MTATSRLLSRVDVLAAVLGAALVGGGCGYYPYTCENYSECEGTGSACPGQCVPLPPLDFSGPTLLWMGDEDEAPGCPERAPQNVYEGHADLDASNECPPCACSQPACVLPSGLTASSGACPGGGAETAFDAPAGWDGSCVSPATVPAEALGSVTLEAVTVRPCAPVPEEDPAEYQTSPWGKFARACAGEAIPNVCGDAGMTCLPTAEPPPPGFRQCLLYTREGDPQCPADYPEEYVFYKGLEDTRGCTACECTETAASDCLAWVSIYEDASCGSTVLSTMFGPGPAACFQIQPSSSGLAGMEASWVTNEPGACVASGGVPVGEAKAVDARTFCCQAPPG